MSLRLAPREFVSHAPNLTYTQQIFVPLTVA